MSKDDELDKILDELYDYARQDTMLYRNGLETAKQAIKANYRHIDDIRSAIPEYRDNTDSKIPLPQADDFISVGYNQCIDDIRQALDIGDK